MDPGVRTPLVDFFRRGDAAHDARMLAAQGAIAPGALEQLALLILLSDDPDGDIAFTARETIAALPLEALRAFIARPDTPTEMRQFFAARGIEPSETPEPAAAPPPIGVEENPEEEEKKAEKISTALLSTLPVIERIKIAMKGTRDQRSVLIRDPNKLVSVAVLASPKVTESEIEGFARMANVSEETLRIIATNRSWTKNYSVISALARNPKTPPGISLTLLARLNERDLKTIMIDRNVPEALRLAARKYVVKSGPQH